MQRRIGLHDEAYKTRQGRLDDAFMEAELDFDKKQEAARILDDGVDLGTGRDPRAPDELPGIYARIADRLRFEELPRVVKIAREILRVGSKRGDCE